MEGLKSDISISLSTMSPQGKSVREPGGHGGAPVLAVFLRLTGVGPHGPPADAATLCFGREMTLREGRPAQT